ncbi:MAG: hypothetical protein ACT4N2_06210 [Hyphomicrobium sp.]
MVPARAGASPASRLPRSLLLGALFAVSLIFLDRSETFIYFRF